MKKKNFKKIRLQRNKNIRVLERNERLSGFKKNTKRGVRDSFVHLMAPDEFGLFNESKRAELISFIDGMVDLVRSGKDVRISFVATKLLYPQGFLYFLATLDDLRKKFPERKIISGYPSDDVVEQMMQKVGLLQDMGLSPRKSINHKSVTDWHYYKAVDGTLDNEGFTEIADDIIRVVGNDDTELVTGISEAVTNTQDHAYDRAFTEKPWWLFTCVRDGYLSVVVCDLGYGIPVSLPRTLKERLGSAWWEVFRALTGGGKKHSLLIKAALEYGRTRTHESNRGKGLTQMLQVATEVSGSEFVVQSKRGYYMYNGSDRCFDYNSRIIGTVVSWKVPLPVLNHE